ncbi:TIR-like protein FxsC [Streptomyces sp. PCS3-D2]|uniref:TIR-like protein FxsC n=1 Tax=Streptomyces sp. PCS3-D2 TaxID=1460244 RepID=UPI001F35F1C3|nr:TIR-like protein FxsC [Streptomyces sp. PCS3-D2]WKV75806.1 TIR-like protein FxsC [Streptomyces sp. PCS3-D2]
MPETPADRWDSAHGDALARTLGLLRRADSTMDAVSLADVIWLAAQRPPASVPPRRPGGPPSPARPADAPVGSPPPERLRLARRGRPTGPAPHTESTAVPRSPALPSSLELGRALRPFKRPWRQGRRPALDIAATVRDYARTGELIPAFAPAPERWYDLTLLVDRSPSMTVWQEVLDEFRRRLRTLGAFRAVRVRELYADGERPEIADGRGNRHPPGSLGLPTARSLLLIASDCTSLAWRNGTLWHSAYIWALKGSVALVNPLPPKIWRHVGVDLPAGRVGSPGTPGPWNAALRFHPPLSPVPSAAAVPGQPDWLPLPVQAFSPHSLGRWARLLMRAAPEGCDALFLPASYEPVPPAVREVDRPGREHAVADAFFHLASPAAARLAVLCTPFDRLSLPLVRFVQERMVPEATVADLAEILVAGLFSAEEAADAVRGGVELSYRPGVREVAQRRLGVRDVRTLRQLLARHTEEHPGDSDWLPGADTVMGPVSPAPAGPVTPPDPPRPSLTVRAGGDPARSAAVSRNRPYFFLSYAHTPRFGTGGPDPDMWVERLFRDLCGHVMALTDLPAGAPVGFMDREIRTGEGWSERLGAALAACRVFVPLFSPRYFASETCGREWHAFAQRMIHHQARSNAPAGAIVPALWVPVPSEQLPSPAAALQFTHRSFGERYATEGLYGLIKLRFAEEYERSIYELAKRIVHVAESTSLDPSRVLDYRTVPSAFGVAGSRQRRIRLTVVAPTRHQLPEGRAAEYYGESPLDWNPYHPVSARPLVWVAEELARSLDYRVTVSSFDEQVPHHDGEQAPSSPEVLLLDRWALADEGRRARLAAFDAGHRPWVGVVVPWNRSDPQSSARETGLTARLEETLPSTMNQVLRAAARGVSSMEEFSQLLPRVIEDAAQRYLRHAQALPPRPLLPSPPQEGIHDDRTGGGNGHTRSS